MNAVDKYIAQFDPKVQSRLSALRALFHSVVPDTEESIRYNMPAFKIGKHYLYMAAYKKHIGFYPVYGLPELEEEISVYKAKGTKDSLHFLHSEALPSELLKQIIKMKSET